MDEQQKEIETLQRQLEAANRVEGKSIREKILRLQKEKTKLKKDLETIDGRLEKAESKIEKLNEQIAKIAIKPGIVGKDAEKNEYWFFRDEPAKLFVKKTSPEGWFCYDDEDTLLQLERCLVSKGVRKKKLSESLRKVKGRMRFKKTPKEKKGQLFMNGESAEKTGAAALVVPMAEDEEKKEA